MMVQYQAPAALLPQCINIVHSLPSVLPLSIPVHPCFAAPPQDHSFFTLYSTRLRLKIQYVYHYNVVKEDNSPQKKPSFLTLAEKTKMLSRVEQGERKLSIAWDLHLVPSTSLISVQNAACIKVKAVAAEPQWITQVARLYDQNLKAMEDMLSTWIKGCKQHNVHSSISRYQLQDGPEAL